VVVGRGSSSNTPFFEAFRWESGVMVGLGDLAGGDFESRAMAVSDDGTVIVGQGWGPVDLEAVRWVNGVIQSLGHSVANDVSADGSVIVGQRFRWENGVVTTLGGTATGVSADASVMAGYDGFAPGSQALRWENGVATGLGDLPGGVFFSQALDVSRDGAVVVGYGTSSSGREAFRWENGVMVGLGDFPGGGFDSVASAVSGDGSVVLGGGVSDLGGEPFLWDATHGMRRLQSVLEGLGLDLTGWTLGSAADISADGLTIVGEGLNPEGYGEAWIAVIPEPATALLLGGGLLALALARRRR
jgi:probable HAF family extracellular repeat protein